MDITLQFKPAFESLTKNQLLELLFAAKNRKVDDRKSLLTSQQPTDTHSPGPCRRSRHQYSVEFKKKKLKNLSPCMFVCYNQLTVPSG